MKREKKVPLIQFSYKNLIASKDENFVAILGQNFFSSFILDDDFVRSALVLTDRRLYQVGKLYEKGSRWPGGGLKVSRGRKIINLEDIKSTASKELSKPLLGSSVIAFGILCAVLGILSDVRQSTIIMLVAATVISSLGVFLVVKRKRRYLIVDYEGGGVALPVKFSTQSELDLFQGLICIEADKVKNGLRDPKTCPYCFGKIEYKARVCRHCGREQNENPSMQTLSSSIQ